MEPVTPWCKVSAIPPCSPSCIGTSGSTSRADRGTEHRKRSSAFSWPSPMHTHMQMHTHVHVHRAWVTEEHRGYGLHCRRGVFLPLLLRSASAPLLRLPMPCPGCPPTPQAKVLALPARPPPRQRAPGSCTRVSKGRQVLAAKPHGSLLSGGGTCHNGAKLQHVFPGSGMWLFSRQRALPGFQRFLSDT